MNALRARAMLAAAVWPLLLGACTETLFGPKPDPMPMYVPAPVTDITRVTYAAADALRDQMRTGVPTEIPIIVATIANLNSLDESSPLGRLMGEQIAARLAQGGYKVVEVKLRNQLYMKRNEGELMLTRELRDVARRHSAGVVVAGSYVESKQRVFVNLKAIRLEDNVLAGAVDFQLERDAQVRSLLGSGNAPGGTLR